jgi:hypothetical protein
MAGRLTAHQANCDGSFYVVDGECMGCGAPESEAEGMMSHDGSGHCFFTAQPKNSGEVDAAVRALWASCCGAVRYAGNDQAILARIAELGEGSKCDEKIESTAPSSVRSRVTFAYRGDNSSVESSLRSIIRFIASSHSTGSYERCTDFKYGKSEASFVLHWFDDCSIRFRVVQILEGTWLVSIEDNDRAKIGIAISLDKSLQASDLFTEIQWFKEVEQISSMICGAVHPY